jgi:hypothetical protein
LRKLAGCTIEDDGTFFIPLANYLEQFIQTDFCFEGDFNKYKHSVAFHDFTDDQSPSPQTFFTFTLDRDINFLKEGFAISVSQQGNRLGSYRLKDPEKKFEPSQFNILLGKTNGTFSKANFGSEFMFSLTNEDLNLTAGEYVIMIDPIWNASAKADLEYKKIYIDIYAPL